MGYLRARGDGGSRVVHGLLLFLFLTVSLTKAVLMMAVTGGMWVQSWNPPIIPIFYSLSQTLFLYLLPHLSRSLPNFHLYSDCFSPSNMSKNPFKLSPIISSKDRCAAV